MNLRIVRIEQNWIRFEHNTSVQSIVANAQNLKQDDHLHHFYSLIRTTRKVSQKNVNISHSSTMISHHVTSVTTHMNRIYQAQSSIETNKIWNQDDETTSPEGTLVTREERCNKTNLCDPTFVFIQNHCQNGVRFDQISTLL